MYELSVSAEFCAAHSIRYRGRAEPVHGHNWRVTAVVGGERLDEDGLLCDFHAVERVLREIAAELNNRSLNDIGPFASGTNPTAELVAKHIFEELERRLPAGVKAAAAVVSVTVTEAPGCAAVYRAGPKRG